MESRPVGRTNIALSVVGAGTAQLQMVPERQAVATLVHAFDRGINWVHTAPDYGGIDPWIRRAIDESGRDVMVLSAGPDRLENLPPFFENTCRVYGTPHLAMYGISGIEDLEWRGENVWGAGGMIDYLQARKREERLGGIYCSTHAPADYVERLIESGAFDAIMLAWNPLGFHQQSHQFARNRIGRGYEDLAEYRERIFPLAAARGVSLLIMKPFAGGLLCRGKALPPHDWYATGAEPLHPPDVLRLILQEPGVCSVVPGSASPEEAEENASAGETPIVVSVETRARIARAVEPMRTSLCSRCGACDTTCSRSLAIPAMFRDAYIWTSRNETSMANPTENYFDLHPQTLLTCDSCTERTCECPQGLSIPSALTRIHDRMQILRSSAQHPGPSDTRPGRIVDGSHRVLVMTSDVPASLDAGQTGIARFLVQNTGRERWMASQHTPDLTGAVGIGVLHDGELESVVPLRNTVCPGEVSPLVFEFSAPERPGALALAFCLLPLHPDGSGGTTIFHTCALHVAGSEPAGLMAAIGRLLRDGVLRGSTAPASQLHGAAATTIGAVRSASPRRTSAALTPAARPVYGVDYLDHSLSAPMNTSVTYGARMTMRNSGTFTWRTGEVAAHVSVDDTLLAVLPLPQPEVLPDQQAVWHFAFRADDRAGTHRVRVELIHHGVAAFAERGVTPWTFDAVVHRARMTESVRLAELSRKHNPWYYNPLTSIAHSADGRPYPLFIARGKGCRVWDAEGHEFLDYTMGWGSTILGHADDRIQAAIAATLDSGSLLPFPHPIEMDVSRMLLDEFPGNDMVVFGKNGSDVCTIAARLARVVTRKTIILSCGFHGWQDFALDYFPFEECGIPERPERGLYKFRFNDLADFFSLYDRCKDDLAAVMIEPAGPLIDEESGLGGEADASYLQTLADAARKAKALLIFDEIITGFRYRHGSVQNATGVTPDLTCLGKALASGMPLSALIGPYRIFLEHFHKTHFCPTFRGEVYSLAAAQAAIGIYRAEPVADRVWRYGEALRSGIHEVCRQHGVAGVCTGPPFRMQFVFREADPLRRQLKRTLLMQELLKQRVITVTGMMLPSSAHDDRALSETLTAFGNALEVVAHADRTNQLHRYIELTLL